MTQRPHEVSPENVPAFKDWLANRGGIAIWRSVNLSNPGASWSSPALDKEGNPTAKPTWEAANEPERIVKDIAEVVVIVPREVKRFHVAIRLGDQGFSYKLTDGATRRVRAAIAKANQVRADELGEHDYSNEAWYEFDYATQEAVILVPDRTVPLAEWTEGG